MSCGKLKNSGCLEYFAGTIYLYGVVIVLMRLMGSGIQWWERLIYGVGWPILSAFYVAENILAKYGG